MKNTFGSRLAKYRKEKGLTQEELAEQLHISPQAVSKWENDISTPDLDTIIKLSEIYGMSTDELLGKQKSEDVDPEIVDDDKKVKDGIHIHNNKNNVHIDLDGVHVDEDDSVHIDSDGIHITSGDGDEVHIGGKGNDEYKLKIINKIEGALFTLSIVAYILLGLLWNDQTMGWKMGWLVFLLPIIIGSLFKAIVKKRFHTFNYPVAVTFTYCLLGFLGGYLGFEGWGFYWFLFITIPAYYAVVSPIDYYLENRKK